MGGIPKPEIVIGLVNIMPAPAMRATENLFRSLLGSIARSHDVHLRLFAPSHYSEGIARSGAAQSYECLDRLWNDLGEAPPIDALIVTGTESQAQLMEDEPSWRHLQRICDWAAENTISTIWSCFSAHAAVLHIDGIRRRRLEEKLSGVFHCRKAADHFLTNDLPAQFPVPHSRYNGISEAELLARDYKILSHSRRAGVDSFTKRHGRSLFVFLQGHPEYGAQVLLGEYCRDFRRFIAGERAQCPNLPEDYLDEKSLRAMVCEDRPAGVFADDAALSAFAKAAAGRLEHRWREPAQQLYGAWLSHIAAEKFSNWARNLAYINQPEAAR